MRTSSCRYVTDIFWFSETPNLSPYILKMCKSFFFNLFTQLGVFVFLKAIRNVIFPYNILLISPLSSFLGQKWVLGESGIDGKTSVFTGFVSYGLILSSCLWQYRPLHDSSPHLSCVTSFCILISFLCNSQNDGMRWPIFNYVRWPFVQNLNTFKYIVHNFGCESSFSFQYVIQSSKDT